MSGARPAIERAVTSATGCAARSPGRLRCLWLTRWYPYPAHRGALVYARNLIERLAASGAEVTAVGLEAQAPSSGRRAGVRLEMQGGVTWHVVTLRPKQRFLSLLTHLPAEPFRIGTEEYRAELKRRLDAGPWDAVIMNHVGMAWAWRPVREWRRRRGAATAMIYVSHNHEASIRPEAAAADRSGPILRQVLRLDAAKTARLERTLVGQADLVTTITEEDKQKYSREFPRTPLLALLPGYTGPVISDRQLDQATPRRCVILGSHTWIVKQRTLWDFIAIADPVFQDKGIELDIVGEIEPRLASNITRCFPSCRVIGFVDDYSPYLLNSRVGIMPDAVGGGFKHKCLNYVFHGLPVAAIASQINGLPLESGRDVIGAHDQHELVQRIVEALDDVDRLDALRRRALARCRTHFDWSERGTAMLAAIADLARDKRTATAA